ncbi:hypothetical protein [Streptomyces sp. NBC_00094]|uniref:hypothetical protein n=1 Tax=Streptomyces sp. NBC_00094 TaxID=2903620 RepID=UPI002B1DA2E0|nr:hypothetical protein [Streptomyces sp. NBC_00094]
MERAREQGNTSFMPPAYTTFDLTGPHLDTPDLVVDGRPLLRRLDEVEGIDAVSPLAADLPPTVRPEHLRRLLLATGPAHADGRLTVYSCPECADPGCGTVTAVVERDGEDVVWRDFAWQTGDPDADPGDPDADPGPAGTPAPAPAPVPVQALDLARDGYPGVGPYRFRGDTYRAVLLRLLAGATTEPPGTPLVRARAAA